MLNETIARGANKADNYTGRFWDWFLRPAKPAYLYTHANKGRFKSQAPAVLICIAYIDLNAIRAVMEKTSETSDYTSIKQKIEQLKAKDGKYHLASKLYRFAGNARTKTPQGLPFLLKDYIKPVDETGRLMRDDKRGFLSKKKPPILKRLNIEPENWLTLTKNFQRKLKGLVGSVTKLKYACLKLGYEPTPCLNSCKNFFT